ncbi:helix-turn-helix transcriptional regulator [Mucilaginibacter sp. PAMB04274]|uniref:AraC family transcriptional regulator n=1 Tax=Mucilaginibacter sp. PAMB04274 TaxID=3138568 RepID=UPI0031F6F8A2
MEAVPPTSTSDNSMMGPPISIHLPEAVKANSKRVKYNPGMGAYPVPHAICELVPYPEAPMVSQQFSHVGFYMQLLEIKAAADIRIRFDVLYPATFLTFVFKGTIDFYDEAGLKVSQATAGTFYLSYNGTVTYEARLKKGPHQLLIVTLSENELLPARADFPRFDELLKHLAARQKAPVILPYCAIGQTIRNYLDRMLHYTADNAMERGAGILVLLTKCLGFYHRLLANNQYIITPLEEADARRLMEFLQTNYHTESVNRLSAIAEALQLTGWQVRKLAKKYLGKPVHRLVIELRMSQAATLLKDTNKSIRSIALAVGYDNEAYFSTAFTKFYQINPSVYRKNR